MKTIISVIKSFLQGLLDLLPIIILLSAIITPLLMLPDKILELIIWLIVLIALIILIPVFKKYENLARCIKDIDKRYGVSVSCYMGDLYYSVKTKKGNNPTEYYISTKRESNYSSEDGFKEFSKDMVGTASIDRLYDAYVRKIRFQFPDKSRTVQKPPMEWGIREVGDWPDKRPTILSFEDIMSFRETPSIQDIASNELPDNAPKKRQ